MSQPSPATSGAPPATRWRVRQNLYSWGLVLVLAAFVLSASVALFGHVAGVEFSPQTFERRAFAYYQIPWIGWQVSRVTRSIQPGRCERQLLAEQWLTLPATEVRRWDLVQGERGGEVLDPYRANILCRYFDTYDGAGQPVWLTWSRDHAELAPTLWKTVAVVARSGRYELLPDVFEAAAAAEQLAPAPFAERLNQAVTTQTQWLRTRLAATAPDEAQELQKLESEVAAALAVP